MKYRRFSLTLAALLQLLPIARSIAVSNVLPRSGIAIVFHWALGAVALLGSYDAVSGASTVITSPKTATGTNGVPFTYRITAGPEVPNTFNATPLPPNLTVNTSSGRITGTPAATGVFSITIVASDNNKPSRTTSATLTLTIVPAVSVLAPSITTQPVNQTVTAGGNASFTVVAGGTAPLGYQWRFNGSPLSGATSATYTMTAVQAGNAGSYSVVVSNSAGSATSANATLTVNPVVVAPTIVTQPQDLAVLTGGAASFSVVAGGTAPLSYQWRFNGSPISGATNSTLSLSNVQASNAGAYSVLVSNSGGSATSASASLAVQSVAVAPTITTQPTSHTVTAGDSATFAVAATGTGPLAYQWYFNGVPMANATSATLPLSNVQSANAGTYSVIVSNSAGTATSADATLTVNAVVVVAPSIVTEPQSHTVAPGANFSFSVVAAGTGPLSYQWRFNGANISGGTSATLSLSNVQSNQAGNYSVIVANNAGSVTSADAALTIQTTFQGGKYSGLFYEENAIAYEHAGLFTITVADSGKCKGTLQIGASRYAFSGLFNADGPTTATASSPGQISLTMVLQWDSSSGTSQINGTVSDGTWTASLLSDRAVFNAASNPCPFAGIYSVTLPGLDPALPSGVGSVTVDVKGTVKMKGVLGDGTKVKQRTAVSQSGDWPLYAPVRRGTGALMGWMQITDPTGGSLQGDVIPLTPGP